LVELMAKLQEKLQLSIPYQVLPLQDSVDLAKLMIQTTLSGQNLSVGRRGVGGPIDIAVVTKVEGLKYIQKKELKV
ncbi:MAG: hypothetical protein QGD88_12260, partial [Anaerolineae bacterium]|nr:hypothetical protein [Anaerolineae bacterium]